MNLLGQPVTSGIARKSRALVSMRKEFPVMRRNVRSQSLFAAILAVCLMASLRAAGHCNSANGAGELMPAYYDRITEAT